MFDVWVNTGAQELTESGKLMWASDWRSRSPHTVGGEGVSTPPPACLVSCTSLSPINNLSLLHKVGLQLFVSAPFTQTLMDPQLNKIPANKLWMEDNIKGTNLKEKKTQQIWHFSSSKCELFVIS